MQFAGKTIAITGAGAGIGAAYAEAFAREGGRVAIVDIDAKGLQSVAQLVADAGGECLPLMSDVADEAQAQAAVEAIAARWGEVDILINNAGIAYGDIYQLTTISAERLRRLLDVNLLGMLFWARACRPGMQRRGGGAIVNMSSMASYMANGPYGLTKAAVNNLTLALADEFAADNIRVNSIAPGLIASPAATENVSPRFRERIQAAQLVRRGGTMNDVTALALFLCSPQASFISGQTMLVDGGFLRHSALAIPMPLAGLPNE
jgi:NAD(P)-dependent dehydrogenase (short-subunit alcohol dehydrogenase family)